jgi:hypothetical protein
MMNKIFCIGLHKTGTITMSKIAKQLGVPVVHNTDEYQIPHGNRSRRNAIPEEISSYANELISKHSMKNTLNEKYI